MSDNKTRKVHIEVSHDKSFERYDVQSYPMSDWIEGATLIGGPDTLGLSPSRKRIYLQIVNKIFSHDCFNEGDVIYFKQANSMYSLPHEDIYVDINSTQHVLFNTPLNLMFTAACTDNHDVTFYSDVTGERIVRLIRYAMSVNISNDCDHVGMHLVYLKGDHVVLNSVSTRTIQYNHIVRLINCKSFVSQLTNGNLLLAFADIYHNNLDDDIITIENPLPGVTGVVYDQFSKYSYNNIIEVNGDLNDNIYTGDFNPGELDNTFVEFLTYAMQAIIDRSE